MDTPDCCVLVCDWHIICLGLGLRDLQDLHDLHDSVKLLVWATVASLSSTLRGVGGSRQRIKNTNVA